MHFFYAKIYAGFTQYSLAQFQLEIFKANNLQIFKNRIYAIKSEFWRKMLHIYTVLLYHIAENHNFDNQIQFKS